MVLPEKMSGGGAESNLHPKSNKAALASSDSRPFHSRTIAIIL